MWYNRCAEIPHTFFEEMQKNEKVTLKNITPLEFKDKFLKINLDELSKIDFIDIKSNKK